MGVCEGTPQAMLPDHLGRADYHGAAVNQVGAVWQWQAVAAGAMPGLEACLLLNSSHALRSECPFIISLLL